MKIMPVQSNPIIGSIGSTPSPSDRLARAKAAMQGQPMPEPQAEEPDTIELGDTPTSATQRIKMNTNRSTDRDSGVPQQAPAPQIIVVPTPVQQAPVQQPAPQAQPQTAPVPQPAAQAPQQPVAQTTQPAPEGAVSDTGVQAKLDPGVTRPISPELAELAKAKRDLQVKERELAERETKLQAQLDGYIPIDALKTNMLGTLQKRGFDQQKLYSQLTDEILGQKSQPDFNQFKEEILKSIDERLGQRDGQQEEAVYAYMADNIEKMARNNIAYRLIRETKSEGKVMDLVKRSWKEKGEILSEDEAMDLIESELREEAKRFARLNAELSGDSKPVEQEPEAAPTPQEPRGVTKTLTNKDSARIPMNRRQRAIAAMLGQKT